MNRPEHSVYAPMTPQKLATDAEVEAMHAKLAAKVKGSPPLTASSPTSGAGQSPKEKARLEWNKPTSKTDTALKTKCGRYSCCRVTVEGKLHYELWKLAPGAGWFTRIDKGAGLGSFLQAQVLAQEDADKS